MTTSSKTQECTAQMLTSKPMYKESKCMWGCITWCKFCISSIPCVCVCVCTCSQDLKLAIKQALELLILSSLRSFEIHNFIACSLFSVSLLLHLRCCQLWLLFLLQLQYKSRKRSSNNSRTQKTNKQKKPKKLKAKKNLPLSTLSNKKQFLQN